MKSYLVTLGCGLIKMGLILSAFGCLLSAILGGCGPATVEPAEAPTTEPRPVVHSIELREGETYTITLETDPSSGNEWEVEFSEVSLELVDHTTDDTAGEEVFTFRARAVGVTEAYFSCSRRHEVICNFTIGADPALADAMSEAEAREIATSSECGEAGALLENAFYNDWTATWWIDLDAEQEGCMPACVVNVRTRQAEINWRCTGGVLPPEDATLLPETVEPPAPAPPPTETAASTAGEPVACWYGRVDSAPSDCAIDRYLVLLPEEARRAVDVIGADESVEAEIEGLRDSGTYAHFWGMLNCEVPGWGGCQLVVTRLRPEGPEGPFFDPDPVEGWTGTIFSTPDDAQFDDYFVLSGDFRAHYGIDSADATIAAQLESLRDTGSIVRVWGQVTCPVIDFQGSQIQVDRIEIVMEALPAGDEYEGWKPYMSERFGYALRYPGECTVMGAKLDESVTFSGPLVDNEHWPVLTVSHYDSDLYHPPAGTDLQQWIIDLGMPYDEIGTDVQIAGLPAVCLKQAAGPGWYASDEYYFIRGEQLFRITILHAGRQHDWELYSKFLESFTFP